MSFREIIAELPNLTEDEKRELLGLLAQELNQDEESPEFLAMLKARIDAADRGGRRYTLANPSSGLGRGTRPASAHESPFFVQCFECGGGAINGHATGSASGDRAAAPISTGQFRSTRAAARTSGGRAGGGACLFRHRVAATR